MNIVLIGMRGSGKTTIAKLLAEKTQKKYLDLDELMVKKTGMTIQKLVDTYGWSYFREKETEIVKEISQMNNTIISAGGGIVINPDNITALKKHSKFIYLKAPIQTLLQRINIDPQRPPLTDKKNPQEEMLELYKQRKHLYEKYSDEIINTEMLTPKEITNIILKN